MWSLFVRVFLCHLGSVPEFICGDGKQRVEQALKRLSQPGSAAEVFACPASLGKDFPESLGSSLYSEDWWDADVSDLMGS